MSNVRHSRIETGLRWRTFLVVLFVAMTAIVWPNLAFNQQVSGTITGFVTDASGAVIPGATVTATNVLTGVATVRTTVTSGLYVFTNLIPGNYSIAVTATGFQKFVRQNVVLSVDSTMTVDAHMELGQMTQEVTVTGAAPLLNVQKADVSATISSRALQELPTVQRNVSALVILAPGVTQNSYQQGMAEDPSLGYQATANGQFWGTNNYQLDGIADTQFALSGYQYIVPVVDGIQEVKVTTSNYDAELGHVGGLVAQYSTKSGTNEFHGSTYEFNQNSSTFAANPYVEKIPGTGPKGLGTGPSPFNQNTFGVTLGGPIKKDKAFFFGDYQGGRLAQSAAQLVTVPTSQFQAGNLSAALGAALCFNPANPSSNGVCGGSFTSPLMVPTTEGGTIQARKNMVFDPTTGKPDGTGRSAFTMNGVANMIPPGRINPVTKNLLNLLNQELPKANGTMNQSLADNNFTGVVPGKYRTDQEDARVDLNLSENNRLFFRYSILGALLSDPQMFGLAGGRSAIGWNGEIGHYRNQLAAINYTHTFSPTLMAEFRFGVARFALVGYQYDVGHMTDDQVGILGINTSDPRTQGLAGMTISGPVGAFTMGDPTGQGLPRINHDTQFEWVNNWNHLVGKHQLRWGLDVIRYRMNFLTVNESSRGDFQFNQLITSVNGIPGTGLGMGTFLLGTPSYYDIAVFSQMPAERNTRIAPYFQDDFHVTRKLILNLGVRYDYIGPSTAPFPGGGVNFDPDTGNLILAGLGSVDSASNVKPNYKNFEPRLGFAYRALTNTVVRGGFGRSYFQDQYGGGIFGTKCCSYPVQTRENVSQSNSYFPITIPPQTAPFAFDPHTPIPPAPLPVFPSNGLIPLPQGLGAYAIPFKNETAYLDNWNITLQHQLQPNLTMTLAYVGNVGRHLYQSYNMNAAIPGPGPVSPRRPLYNRFGIDTSIGMRAPCGKSAYHALEYVVDKRVSEGYTIYSQFTWAKSLTRSYQGIGAVDPYARNLSYARDYNNRAAVWTMSHIWNLPYGRAQHWGGSASPFAQALLGGWVFNGITSVMSGLPVAIGWSNTSSLNNGGDFGQRPDLVDDPFQNIPPGLWYNPKAFANPAACTAGGPICGFGNYDSGSISGPSYAAANWALWKTFRFKTPLAREDTSLEFRFESYNLFNRTNKATPNGTADSALAGTITNLFSPMRQFQFGIRLVF